MIVAAILPIRTNQNAVGIPIHRYPFLHFDATATMTFRATIFLGNHLFLLHLLFLVDKLSDEWRRVVHIVQNPGMHFSASDSNIEDTPFFTISELVGFTEDIL